MSYSNEDQMCCLCLNDSNTPFSSVHEKYNKENSTNFERISSTLSELANVMSQTVCDYMICSKCCKTIEMIYKFNNACLQNVKIYSRAKMKTGKNPNVSEVTDKKYISNVINICEVEVQNSAIDKYRETSKQCFNEVNEVLQKNQNHETEENIQKQLLEKNLPKNKKKTCTKTMKDKGCNFSYTCTICLKSFGQKHHLRRHEEQIHNPKKQLHCCETCGKTFGTKDALKQHMLIHSGEKTHICHICGKAFGRKDDLNQHSLIHTGDKPHFCELCGTAFRHRTSLFRHKLTHTGEKPHACDVCSKAFIRKRDLNDHKLIHSGLRPFACNFCDQKFRLKHVLVKHIRIHTGEKPYMCDVCSKTFTERSHLVRHSLTHTTEKPYACDICGEKFKTKSILAKHINNHEKQVPIVPNIQNLTHFNNPPGPMWNFFCPQPPPGT